MLKHITYYGRLERQRGAESYLPAGRGRTRA